MTPGCFIVLEGPEGAGKSTLARALAARLTAAGIEPICTREPGGTPVAEALRSELLNADRSWTPDAELLYMVTARADLVARVIGPALDAGRVVLSDRYALSTQAYQVAGRGVDQAFADRLLAVATLGLVPGITLVVDLAPEEGIARQQAAGKRQDRLDRESLDFHRRVAARYLAEHGPRVHHLDGRLTPEGLADAAWTILVGTRPDLFHFGV
jgi:dTMP kinase